ncbi:glycosyltransferase [Empedobacter falsenii]
MSEIKLAIVIPYYKLTFFEETLISLQNQSNQNFNLYIGDDSSPENPSELIDKYSSIITKYKRYDTNIGGKYLTKQWERCIDDLTENEEWIMLLCDDDYLDLIVVEEFYKLINEGKVTENVIKYATRIVNEEGTEIVSEHVNNNYENSINFLIQKILNYKRSTLSEHIFKNDIYKLNRFKEFELAFGSDDVAWVDFTNGNNFICINNSFINYRKSVLSISNNQDNILKKRKMEGIISAYTYILKTYHIKMNLYQKKVLSKKVYQNNRALYRKLSPSQLKLFLLLIRIIGIKETINVIRTNKYYYEKPD